MNPDTSLQIPSQRLFLDTVAHGDCVEVMRQMPAASVDFILTDPPYLVNYRSRDHRTIKNDVDNRWLKPAFAEAHRVLGFNRFCVCFYGWSRADQFIAAWRAAGFRTVGHLVFCKRYASSTHFLRYQHEQAYLLAKGNPQRPSAHFRCAGNAVYRQSHPPDAETDFGARALDRELLGGRRSRS